MAEGRSLVGNSSELMEADFRDQEPIGKRKRRGAQAGRAQSEEEEAVLESRGWMVPVLLS